MNSRSWNRRGCAVAERIIGLKALDRKLRSLEKQGTVRVSRATMVGMAAPLRSSIRKETDATAITGRGLDARGLKKAAKATVGSSIKRDKDTGELALKVGYGVGKQSKLRKTKATARAAGGDAGVGISAANVHWIVLGTGKHSEKTSSERTKKGTGGSTGSTEQFFDGVIPKAVTAGSQAALRKAADKARIALRKVAKKRR